MTEITWTNCAEKMPPDDSGTVIYNPIGTVILFHVEVVNGSFVQLMELHPMRWTEFTKEKWEELNK